MSLTRTVPRVPVTTMVAATFALNTAIGVTIHALGREPLLHNLVFSHCIGFLTLAFIDAPRRRLWPTGAPRLVPMIMLVLVGASLAWILGSMLGGLLLGIPRQPFAQGSHVGIGFIILTITAGFAGTYFFWTRERLAAADRLAAEARLQALAAQIEPHFLFNTLANLKALIDLDPARAKAMLTHLDRLLRAGLAATRAGSSTLAQEFALIRDYLEIIAMRMGPRLTFTLDLPESLDGVAVPPMLLQPLVENAVRHGLEPKVAGGRVAVRAQAAGARVVVTVEDDGLGMANAPAGTGVGLANVRERLDAAYGRAAEFAIEVPQGGGARMRLSFPSRRTA